MRDNLVRKPPKKGLPFDTAQLKEIAAALSKSMLLSSVRLKPELSLLEWADLVNIEWMRKKTHLLTGFLLFVAKRMIPHGQWLRLFSKHPQAVVRPLRMSDRTAERLIYLVRRHPTWRNPTHGSNLPSSWRTQAELARIPPTVLESFLADGRIHPKLTRATVSFWIAWQRSRNAPRPDANARSAGTGMRIRAPDRP